MKKTFYFLIFLLFLAEKNSAQEISYSGRIIDAQTNEQLAFVSIVFNSKNQGLVSDVNGRFELPENAKVEFLKLSYIGYKTKLIPKNKLSKGEFMKIKLQSQDIEIEEVTVVAKENPAHRIIRLASKNKKKNNPENLNSFSYTGYHKVIFTTDFLDSVSNSKGYDTIQIHSLDSTSTRKDSMYAHFDSLRVKEVENAKKLFEAQHLFITENVSKRIFLKPNRNKEEVIASRMAGLEEKSFPVIGTELQSLSFYNDFIKLLDKSYLNPISKGSTKRYFFQIQDTIMDGKDSIFVIYYRPKKYGKIDGLEGTIQIHTNAYAIYSVIAEPYEKEDNYMKIQHHYNFLEINGQKAWFPVQLHSRLSIDGVIPIGYRFYPLLAISQSYFKDIQINPQINKKDVDFGHEIIEMKEDACDKDESFWSEHRGDSLTAKESMTYQTIDSISQEYKLEQKLWGFEAFLKGYFTIGRIDWNWKKFVRYNRYEGLGLGLDFLTNNKISEHYAIGGYFSYGFAYKDKTWKYGGVGKYYLDQYKENLLYATYDNDVHELGGYSFFKEKSFFVIGGSLSLMNIRNIKISEMFRYEKKQIGMEFRALEYVQGNIFLAQNRQYLKNYFYANNDENLKKYLHQTEIGFQCRYAFREQYLTLFSSKIPKITDFPIVWLNIRKGIKTLNGQYNYLKTEAKITKIFQSPNLGTTFINLFAGYTTGDLSLLDLYNGHGSRHHWLILQADNSFNTMKMHEFTTDKFVNFFFKHRFLPFEGENKWIDPRISIMQGVGFGFLSDKYNAIGNLKSYEKGYFETGLVLDNFISNQIPYLSDFSFLGIGIFYRYGEYTSKTIAHNFTFNTTINFLF